MTLAQFIQGFYIQGGIGNLCIIEFIKGFAQGIGFLVPTLIIGAIFREQIRNFFNKE